MNKVYITNSFSINMLPERGTMVDFVPLSCEYVSKWLGATKNEIVSGIGHADTAKIVSGLLGIELHPNRINIKLRVGRGECDDLIIAQYIGPRLPEGTTMLPEGATIKFWAANLGMEYCTEPI